ncbi:AIPR family protein [Streptomyces sp. NPDC006290]|uniref:AIPR family protein n=1 Tax=Streptomyces sp. NPDC006290 TaxID=3156745 RepID=UPI0033B6A30C
MSTPRTSQSPAAGDGRTQVHQVAKAFDDTYTELIDMSDFGNRQPDQLSNARRSRALAAHAVRIVTGWSADRAAACVIDGGGDQGIDAIAVVPEQGHIYLVQAKWSEKCTATADETAVLKLFAGLSLIDNGEADQFNPRGQVLARRAKQLLIDEFAKVTQVIVLMGTREPAPGVRQAISNGEKDFNHHGERVGHRVILAPEIHATARGYSRPEPVTLEARLHPWFPVTEPYRSYQGVIQAEQIVSWAEHDTRLFDLNIRNPLGLTPINSEMVSTLSEEPANFWYFNNGITILCDSLKAETESTKSPQKFPVRLIAHGASVVNGAQTVRAIIDAARGEDSDAELAQVAVRIIETGGNQEFAKRTTQATNRQNHITERDYIALESVQAELIDEFRAELGLVYSVRRSELEPQGDEGCSVVEAACALACAHSGSRFVARLVAADSTDVLWERGGSGLYDPLFHPTPGVHETWNAVRVLRAVRGTLRAVREKYQGRGAAVIADGTFLVTHLVLRQLLAGDAAIGEPDPTLAWADAACAQVPKLTERTVPALLSALDAVAGARSDLKRVCSDPADCAALVHAALAAVNGEAPEAAQKYLRTSDKPRKRRRPNAVHVLVDQRALREGAQLRLNLYVPGEQQALEAWLGWDASRSRATWSNNRGRPIIWAADGQAYSPSGLIARMWELAEWEGRPVSNQGTERWITEDGETLAELAWKLLDGLENAGLTDIEVSSTD